VSDRSWETLSIIILQGEHGSGKTIQIPALISQQSVGDVLCKSLVVQPNILNARAVVHWMNQSLFAGGKLSGKVELAEEASKIGAADSLITYTTDEVLSSFLTEEDGIKAIDGYRVVFIDDIHYRSTATELLLMRIQSIISNRDKVENPIHFILMSAPQDFERLANHFGIERDRILSLEPIPEDPAKPLMKETYAAESTYSALPAVYTKIQEIVDRNEDNKSPQYNGILVYLRNEADVQAVFHECQGRFQNIPCKKLSLHVPIDDPENAVTCAAPKIVLTTDSMALGLTIKHIYAVIVTGTLEVKTFDPSIGHSLVSEVILSLAEIQQQAWRVGRNGQGECHYMFKQEVAQRLAQYKESDIPTSDSYQYILGLFSIFPDRVPYKASMKLMVYPQSPVAMFMIRRLRLLSCIGRMEEDFTGGYVAVGGAPFTNSIPNLSENARLLLSRINPAYTSRAVQLTILMACIISEPRRQVVHVRPETVVNLDEIGLQISLKITQTGDVWMQLWWLVKCILEGVENVKDSSHDYRIDEDVFMTHHTNYQRLSAIYKTGPIADQFEEEDEMIVLTETLRVLSGQLLHVAGGSPAEHVASGVARFITAKTILDYKQRPMFVIYLDLTEAGITGKFVASNLLCIPDDLVGLVATFDGLTVPTYLNSLREGMKCLNAGT
jgi:hypothetical protein